MAEQSDPSSPGLRTPSVTISQIAYVELPTPMNRIMYRRKIESQMYHAIMIAMRNTSVTKMILISVSCL